MITLSQYMSPPLRPIIQLPNICMSDYPPSRSGYSPDYRKNYKKSRRRKSKRYKDYQYQTNCRDLSYKNHSEQMYSSNQSQTENERESQHLQTIKATSEESIDIGPGIGHVRRQSNQEEPIFQKAISQSHNSENLTSLAQEFLQEIQNLDYKKLNFHQLQQQFKQIVQGHIVFKGIYPQSLPQSNLGHLFIVNGLFHQMWGNVLLKSKQNHSFWVYYQKYQNILQKNHSNFESMFNQFNSMQSQTPQDRKYQEETNSNTNLLGRQKKQYRQIVVPSILKVIEQDRIRQDISDYESINHNRTIEHLNFSSKENLLPVPTQNKEAEINQKGRVSYFGYVQTNQRKLNTDIICFFLGINKVYKLETVHFSQILQLHLTARTQLVLLEGQVEAYCEQVKRIAVNYIPKLLLIAYGELNLATLLRLKNTYGKIEGLVVYDQLLDIKDWLKGHALITEEDC